MIPSSSQLDLLIFLQLHFALSPDLAISLDDVRIFGDFDFSNLFQNVTFLEKNQMVHLITRKNNKSTIYLLPEGERFVFTYVKSIFYARTMLGLSPIRAIHKEVELKRQFEVAAIILLFFYRKEFCWATFGVFDYLSIEASSQNDGLLHEMVNRRYLIEDKSDDGFHKSHEITAKGKEVCELWLSEHRQAGAHYEWPFHSLDDPPWRHEKYKGCRPLPKEIHGIRNIDSRSFEELIYEYGKHKLRLMKMEHLGAAGGDQGQDIVGIFSGELNNRKWIIQCKSTRELTLKKDVVKREFEKHREVIRGFDVFMLASNGNISDTTRRYLRDELILLNYAIPEPYIVMKTELDSWLREHEEILLRFFPDMRVFFQNIADRLERYESEISPIHANYVNRAISPIINKQINSGCIEFIIRDVQYEELYPNINSHLNLAPSEWFKIEAKEANHDGVVYYGWSGDLFVIPWQNILLYLPNADDRYYRCPHILIHRPEDISKFEEVVP